MGIGGRRYLVVLAMVTPRRSLPVGLESCGLRETSCLKTREVWRPQSHACLWPPRRAGRLLGTAEGAARPPPG